MAAPPAQFTCPITYEVMRDPVVVAPCGHHFDRASLVRTLSPVTEKATCPMCRSAIVSLAPARALKELIDLWQAPGPGATSKRDVLGGPVFERPRFTSLDQGLLFDVIGTEDTSSRCGTLQRDNSDSKGPVHVLAGDRRRSNQLQSPQSTSSLGSHSRQSPSSHLSSPMVRMRTSSIQGHLETFTFGVPSLGVPGSPLSRHSSAMEEEAELKGLQEQLKALEDVGRRHSLIWQQVSRRLEDLRRRRDTSDTERQLSHNSCRDPSETDRRQSAGAAEVRCLPASLRKTSTGSPRGPELATAIPDNPPPAPRPRATSMCDPQACDEYTLAVYQLSRAEAVWSAAPASRRSPCDDFHDFLKSLRRFAKALPWGSARLRRGVFLTAFRAAIDDHVVAPLAYAEPVHTAFSLWEQDVVTADQIGRVLELKALPSSLAPFHHLLDEGVDHTHCPRTCAGRRYCERRQTFSEECTFKGFYDQPEVPYRAQTIGGSRKSSVATNSELGGPCGAARPTGRSASMF